MFKGIFFPVTYNKHKTTFLAPLILLTALASSSSALAGSFTIFGPETFIRESGSPVTESQSFPANDSSIPYNLTVYNGGLEDDEAIGELVSSGSLKINSAEIIGPDNFSQNVSSVTQEVALQGTNQIDVELKGKPGGTITVVIVGEDDTPPLITANIDPAAGPDGWHDTPVTVTFNCTDSTSGIALCSDSVIVSTEGAGQVISGTAVDNAGNTASVSVTLNIDLTLDDDHDGVEDDVDQCANTPAGEAVFADGCSSSQYDADGDSISDLLDLCPGTLIGAPVNGNGCTVNDTTSLPPAPETVATESENGIATPFYQGTEFLYTGENPIQTGVAAETIDPKRASVTRGRMEDRFGNPVVGVKVSILGASEYGQTLSRADGGYDLAVNGGGHTVLSFEKEGFPTVHRTIYVPWQNYAVLPDVVMTPYDRKVTHVQTGAAIGQLVTASVTMDDDGERQASLFFPAGTTAELVMPDGSTQPLATMAVRATEFTVGAQGPNAMPADLPRYTGYTYAVELSVDEAISAGANTVKFNQAVPFYVDNFLDFPVGGVVPVGYYDRSKAAWIPSDNGRIIQIVGVDAGGLAEIDIDGSGLAADTSALAELGITSAERAQLSSQYEIGKSLWRVMVDHFTPYDCNWAESGGNALVSSSDLSRDLADNKTAESSSLSDPDCEFGSIIECQNQVLREQVPLTGTGLGLHYRSDRVAGRVDNYQADIPLSSDTVPSDLKRIDVRLTVAGRVYEASYPPLPNQRHEFTWDGVDAYGRDASGAAKAEVRIGYVYDGVYRAPTSVTSFFSPVFGAPEGLEIVRDEARQEATYFVTDDITLGTLEAVTQGMGGWTLNAHHAYDPIAKMLYLGSGERRNVVRVDNRVRTLSKGLGFSGDTPQQFKFGSTSNPRMGSIHKLDVASDGAVYFPEQVNQRIRKITVDGTFTTIAGSGPTGGVTNNFSGDGGLATEARLNAPSDVAIGRDGSIYIADYNNHRVRKVGPDGIITTVAGSGPVDGYGEYAGDGGLATGARLVYPTGVAVAPDGTLYILHRPDNNLPAQIIRRVTPDGMISTFAGGGALSATSTLRAGEELLPADAKFENIHDIAVGADGALYILERNGLSGSIFRVSRSGSLQIVAGGGGGLNVNADGIPAVDARIYLDSSTRFTLDIAPGGDIYVTSGLSSSGTDRFRVRKISSQGVITTVFGNDGTRSGGSSALEITVTDIFSFGVAIAPDGTLVVARSKSFNPAYSALSYVAKPMQGFDNTDIAIPSEDGSLLYQFDSSGRHLSTINTLTTEEIFRFEYDSNGYLTGVVDHFDNRITIERYFDGVPYAVVSPDSHRTQLTVGYDGYLSSIVNPQGHDFSFLYTQGGLLTQITDPKSAASTMSYDASGLLVGDDNAENGSWTLTREELEDGHRVTMASALDRTIEHTVENQNGESVRSTTNPDGTVVETRVQANNTRVVTDETGTVIQKRKKTDLRFFGQTYNPDSTITTPAGLVYRTYRTTNTQRSDLTDPLSITGQQILNFVNDRLWVRQYSATTRTYADRSPQGRTSTTAVDGVGQPLSVTVDGLATFNFTYDDRGRLIGTNQGSGAEQRSVAYNYNGEGRLASVVDGLGRSNGYSYDAAGRVTRSTLPDGRAIDYSYDSKGNVTSITPPGRDAHVFSYTLLDQESSYSPPSVGVNSTTNYLYSLDKELLRITRPDGQQVNYSYDTGGRLDTINIPRGNFGFGYDPQTGQLVSQSAPGGESLSYNYDGFLPLSESWSGTVSGSVNRAYNNDLQLTQLSVNGSAITQSYDNDGLLTQAGEFSLTRSSQNGLITATDMGSLLSSYAYNSVGELTSASSQYSGSMLYDVSFDRDQVGRIASKVETVEGVTTTYDYHYDVAGRLSQVKQAGAVVANYQYDSNSNRIGGFTPSGAIAASYDAQDRLVNYNGVLFSYTANGELASKTDSGNAEVTYYDYDILGNLMQARLPDGTQVDYVVDARNRRIGKKVNGVLTQKFLYQDQLNPVAELDAAGNLISRFVYADKANVPSYMIKGGNAYRVVSDHLGSVRLVVSEASGNVMQRMDYDEFGNVINDTNPGFQPFGFAGGLYDQDTKLTRFGARDYDAETGRWTAKDPLVFGGGDVNLYDYSYSDPINYIDVTGLKCGEADDQAVINGLNEAIETADRAETISDVITVLGVIIDVVTVPSGEAAIIGAVAKVGANKAIKEAFERQLKQHGIKSLQRSQRKIKRRLDEHLQKLDQIRAQGGLTSSVEREIRTFKRQLDTLDNILGK